MKKMMFFTNSITCGGVETVFTTYCNGLGNDYTVVWVYCRPTMRISEFFYPNVSLVCLNINRFRKSFFRLVSFLRKEKPDYLVTGGDFPNVYCILAKFFSFTCTKVIISQHNYLNVEYNSLLHKICYKFYRFADKVVVVSHGINDFMKENGVPERKLQILYNPIDINEILRLSQESISLTLPQNYVLFVGRLSSVKNLHFLLNAFETIKKKGSDLKLIFVGDGSEKKSLELEVQKKGLICDVLFVGLQSNPYPYMANARALLLTSFSEALPTVILEAFALGITVVSTPTPGAIDLLQNGKLGYVIRSFDNTEELALAIEKSILHPMDKNILKYHAGKFDIEIKKKEFVNMISELK